MPAQRVIARGTGDDCRAQHPADGCSRQVNRQAGRGGVVGGCRRGSGPSTGETTRDGWAAGTLHSLQEIESNSVSAKVAETNGWVTLL